MFRPALPIALVLALPAIAQDLPGAGTYTLDPSHTSVVFSVNHLGMSNYTASFDDISATMEFDPANPASAALDARIATGSLDLPAPPEGFLAEMLGEAWFNAEAFPDIAFQSETITLTGDTTATIDGKATMLGVSVPMTLEVQFNGGWPPQPFDPGGRVGFSATGSLNRSDFGMITGLPAPGSDIGVGDAVSFRIEAEFTGPVTDQ